MIPFNTELTGLNLTKILELQSAANVNVFNKSDDFFNDHCIAFIDNDIEFDTTISSRRDKFYQNYSIECNPRQDNDSNAGNLLKKVKNCTFTRVDEYGFINCDCDFSHSVEIETTFKEILFEDFLKLNIRITKCFMMFIVPVNINFLIIFLL